MSRKLAIILHGPPCTGKTTIANELMGRMPGTGLTSLDDGWADGENRFRGGLGRYADLAHDAHPVLIVEIACGEPVDLSFPGATRAAEEWVNVLRTAGRELYPFRLTAEFTEIERRLNDRHNNDLGKLFSFWRSVGVYSLYERGHPLATFPPIVDFTEQTLTTSGRTTQQIADEVMAVARLS